MRTHIVALLSAAVLCLALSAQDQQNPPAHHKVLMPEQQTYQQQYQQWIARRQQLQAQAKKTFDAEMAREKAGDCPNANSTYEINVCDGKQLGITDANLKSFEKALHDLLAPGPQMPGEVATPPGVAGPHVAPEQRIAEFESVEQSWRQYREAACTAAFHQFDGGTIAPSVEAQCELKLTRDHMRELDMIYDSPLHM